MGSKIQHGGHCKEQKGNPPQKGIVEQRRIIIGLVNDLEQRLALCRHLGSSTGIQWYNGISARQLQHWIDSILQPAMVLDKCILNLYSGYQLCPTLHIQRLQNIPLRSEINI